MKKPAIVLAAAALALVTFPSSVLRGMGAEQLYEVDLIRFLGALLGVAAALFVAVSRRRDLVPAVPVPRGLGVGAVLAGAFLFSGQPFFLILLFTTTVGMTLQLARPLLDAAFGGAIID